VFYIINNSDSTIIKTGILEREKENEIAFGKSKQIRCHNSISDID